MNKARRYNKGKLRYELIPTFAKECLADVYTKGAHKYSIYKDKEGKEILGIDIPFEKVGNYELIDDASNNWRKGLSWMDTISSCERHIESWKKGEDIDELGTYHLANAAWNLFTLLESYKLHPELDDRNHKYLINKKIGLDVDEVCADWLTDWCKYWNINQPNHWFFDRNILDKFESMRKEGKLEGFYSNLKPLINPKDIPFEPHCYVTSRPVDTKITEEWLDKNEFPHRPVITVPLNKSKAEVLKEQNVDIFIDDRFENFVEINKAGILCLLMDMPHNRRYDVGYKRIMNFEDFKNRFL